MTHFPLVPLESTSYSEISVINITLIGLILFTLLCFSAVFLFSVQSFFTFFGITPTRNCYYYCYFYYSSLFTIIGSTEQKK